MWVDHDGVGELGAVECPAKLLAHRGRARVGRVEMEPGAGVLAKRGDRAPGRPRSSTSCPPSERPQRAFDLLGERVDAHPVVAVDRDEAALEPEQPRRFRRRNFACSDVSTCPPGPQLAARRRGRRSSPSRRCRRCGRAAPSGRPSSCANQSSASLDLGRGRMTSSKHRVHVQRGDDELGEDPRLRARVGEVAEETRVVPVR